MGFGYVGNSRADFLNVANIGGSFGFEILVNEKPFEAVHS